MEPTTWTRRASALMLVAVLVMGVAACSKDHKSSSGPVSKRACARVQAAAMSDILGTKVKLAKEVKDSGRCDYVSADAKTKVSLQVVQPVEANAAKLMVSSPKAVPNLGDEGWVTQENTTLGTTVLGRKKGALLVVDLMTPKNKADDEKLAIAVARAGVPNLPNVAVVKPTGPRGEAACKRFSTSAITKAMGAKPVVTETAPPGSCILSVADQGLIVHITDLKDLGASEGSLDDIVSNIPDAKKTTVGKMPARWIPTLADPTTGGQLDVLSGHRLFQVAVLGKGFKGNEALTMATKIAAVAGR